MGSRPRLLQGTVIFRSKNNSHRYFYTVGGRLKTFVTHQKDFLTQLAALFSRLNVSMALVVACLALFSLAPAQALPTGAQTVAGDVKFAQPDSNTLNVTSNSSRAIVNYNSFNIAQAETVNFNLPSSSAAILNRVIGGSPSEIMGNLNSNGHVFLVNPSGVLFGPSAQVNVGAITASTMDISNDDFMNGNLHFHQAAIPGQVINQGNIQASQAINMLGSAVSNQGTLTAPQVNLAVGQDVSMTVDNHLGVQLTVDSPLLEKIDAVHEAISNTGAIHGNKIAMQAELAANLYDRAVNNEGQIIAEGFSTGEDGSITLIAHADDTMSGLVRNAGLIDASGTTAHANGGQVLLSGDYVTQRGQVLAEGADGGTGGHVEVTSTQGTLLMEGSTTSARGAGANSNAGSIKIWSDHDTFLDPLRWWM